MAASSPAAAAGPTTPAARLYRGVVSHKRWRPAAHGFAYELFMVAVDVDVSTHGD